MRVLLLLALAVPAWAQFGAARQIVNGNGAPNSAQCVSANNVGMVYARKDGAAASSTFYICSNTGVATYEWVLGGGGGTGAAPYSATVTAQTTLAVTAATHGQGTKPNATCVDGSGAPWTGASCNVSYASNGDVTYTFSPAFTGEVRIYGGGTGATGATGATGSTGATGATGPSGLLSGTLAAIPATCTVGASIYQATDQLITEQLYACTATNTWTRTAYTQGTAPPGTCAVGQLFFDTDATAGTNWYGCTATNTWTQLGGGAAAKYIKSFGNVSNPSSAESGDAQFKIPFAATITRVSCDITDSTSVTINLDERAEATPNTAGTAVLTSSLVCDTNGEVTTTFSNASIAANAPVALTISAVSGTPRGLRVHVEYTIP